MASSLIRKTLTPLAAVAILAAPAEADISYTIAAGYVQVTVPGSSLGAISATLQNKSDHTSNADINSDWVAEVPQTPPTPNIPAQQTVTVAGAGWSPGQWTSAGYLAYICDDNGGEESFLIIANTADTLTVATPYDLRDPARNIPATTSISIRLAQTVGKLLGTAATGTDFVPDDKVYLWNGLQWTTYFWVNEVPHPAGPPNPPIVEAGWRKIGSFEVVDDDIIHPDEGVFVQRNDPTDITLTFFGDVPSKAQVTTMGGPSLLFLSSRYPVETTIGQLGFQTLPDWRAGSSGDIVYIWVATETRWETYFYVEEIPHPAGPPNPPIVEAGWRKIGSFDIVDSDPVAADSAIFVSRIGGGAFSLAESANIHALPYTP